MSDTPRLIEQAFPLKQASLDSVHEKNVRHGHISTLHIWPARRPLAACRAALIATLLPDPGTPEKRKELCEKIGGRVVKKIERKKMPNGETVEREKEITEGGILHWGKETGNRELLDWFRQEIRKAYGGRAPKVLDPFAGGGAIPLEAMRLGCEATAVDINPVAWFILKCTLEYPQKLAGQRHALPDFILENEEFMNAFYKAHPHLIGRTKQTKKQKQDFSQHLFLKDKEDSGRAPKADLAWHVRAWGQWVLGHARQELARFYPTYADFEPLDLKNSKPYEKQRMRLVPLKEDGIRDVDTLNAEFSKEYLADKHNPRWVAKPTVAYLWARTVACKNCRATIPLLKTRWLCKKEKKRVLLKVEAASRRSDMDVGSRRAGVHADLSAETALLHYFDPDEPIANLSGNLPHWRQEGVTYFVTFRLADSMPQEKLHQWLEERETWLKSHPEPRDEKVKREYYRMFPERLQAWLDAGYGECLLKEPPVKDLVEQALKYFAGERYLLDEFIVMPNHVHVLVTPIGRHTLSEIVHSWKSFTAHEITTVLNRSGTVWQKESFDHIIRSPAQLEKVRQYIRDNPKVAAASIRVDAVESGETPLLHFGIEANVPVKGGNPAQRREHDKRIGAGTMSRSGAKCPCCSAIMTMEDIRLEGQAGRLDTISTTVVVDTPQGKDYRVPTNQEIELARVSNDYLDEVFAAIPCGKLSEPIAPASTRSISCNLYGLDQFAKAFSIRQQLSLGNFVKHTRSLRNHSDGNQCPTDWRGVIFQYLCLAVDRLADRSSTFCRWDIGYTKVNNTFSRFSLPMLWDYCETNPLSLKTGGYDGAIDWIAEVIEHCVQAERGAPTSRVLIDSAADIRHETTYDTIVTDPPYYEAISYGDISDFFYVWLKRVNDDGILNSELSDKTKEIVQHVRQDKNKQQEKAKYEHGMYQAFERAYAALHDDGRFVVVFAHKDPVAWETLVSAMIRAGLVVTASWPIQTEMANRGRAQSAASLASSVWLVCKKRPATARPGWDNQVLEEMRQNIRERLRDFWDAGIRGPDFVWAATGPALEAYSKHPVVKKANEPGPMSVSEFLTHVRRMVVDFVVGRVFYATEGTESTEADFSESSVFSVADLDSPTAYYLLHRHDFGMDEAPPGACILYAISCGLSDKDLADTWDLIAFAKGKATEDTESTEDDDSVSSVDSVAEEEEESGSKVKLKTWAQRKSRSLGYEAPGGKPVPLIDRLHCLMHLWKAGDLSKVDEYLDSNGLRRHELFKRLLQSLIELSPHGSDERSLLESISNHVQARGAVDDRQPRLAL